MRSIWCNYLLQEKRTSLSEVLADTELIHSERDRQLYAALEKLKVEYREALYLVYLADLSYRNAARSWEKARRKSHTLSIVASRA